MKIVFFSLLFCLAGVTAAHAQNADSFAMVALKQVNDFRDSLHLPRVALAKALSAGCRNHARYLVLNRNNKKTEGLLAHKEFAELPGYSKSGQEAGEHAVIGFTVDPASAVPQLIATFYHRMPFMQPDLYEIGFGCYKDTDWYTTVIDCTSHVLPGKSKIDVVVYPYNGQTNVPLAIVEEIPNPIDFSLGDGVNGGFPVTFFFAQYQSVTNVELKLIDNAGNDILCYVSSPEKPATSFSQWQTVCAIPATKLQPATRYTATLNCTVNDKPYKSELVFTTVPE